MCQANFMNYFDVSYNSLTGQIPKCIIDLSRSLVVLNLEGNKFHGTIPLTYPKSCKLKMINLSRNQLEGSMPSSLANCLDLEVLDIGRNHINDTFPSWLGGPPKLHILVLRHNHFHGKIGRPNAGLAEPLEYDYSITIANKGNDMQCTKILTVFRVIDFSGNNFTGTIPSCIGELRGLQALNLSNNDLQGEILPSLVHMTDLESLDLSNNKLSGEIPQGLTQLTFLEVFNVSYNFLMGPIPQGRQFGAFDNNSFPGNSRLCGPPLSKRCGNAFEPSPSNAIAESNTDGGDSMLIDWIIRCLGCVSEFAVGCAFGKYLTDRNHE
ncbi:hypothetical protein Cgig2_004034 [Carnegiea gigantea]|uniref:Uncharacterized protein n=1 Tax=Carnegiea gigantea TaxID=171969 RepID=A0A9Q1QP43_9CARY|nr:hypothetical protein Cgig2_004034 [Carnegiea gigantea]